MRDYDREPIVIQDVSYKLSTYFYSIIVAIFLLVTIFCIISIGDVHFTLGGIFAVVLCIKKIDEKSGFKDCEIVFKNDEILHLSSARGCISSIKLNKKLNIKISSGFSNLEVSQGIKLFVFAFIGLYFIAFINILHTSQMDIAKKMILCFVVFVYIVIFVFYHYGYGIIKNGPGSRLFNNSIIIFSEFSTIQAIFLSDKEYRELKVYFMVKKGINLDYM